MSDAQIPHNQERILEKALTNKIIDDYFENSESWLRAILRMCIFSLAYLNRQSVFIVECPNQAVAKRLSRKTYPFRGLIYYLTDNFNCGDVYDGLRLRTLFCYQKTQDGTWHCFDTSTNSWEPFLHLQSWTTPTE
ncbi:MAG: hypothetical protein KME59_05550 [Trichormus sp. ATA11-4-KO1]|jgi:hypothetical protein|nr:hypothetical protein [Trichormus sp. ATA11-4-KO1]